MITFFGLILRVQPGSLGMDVKRNIVGPVSISGKSEDEHTWMLTAGVCGSAAEHAVFEQLYGIESVSTEKLLALANRQGIPIYTINRDNIGQILPLINAHATVKQNISDSVLNSGWIAVIPQRGLQVNKWFGYGWQVLDPNSGAAGYMLAGYLTSGNQITAGGSGSLPAPDKVFKWGLLMLVLSAFEKLSLIPEITALAGVSAGAIAGTVLLYFGLALVILAIALYIYSQYTSLALLYNRRYRYDSFAPSFMVA